MWDITSISERESDKRQKVCLTKEIHLPPLRRSIQTYRQEFYRHLVVLSQIDYFEDPCEIDEAAKSEFQSWLDSQV